MISGNQVNYLQYFRFCSKFPHWDLSERPANIKYYFFSAEYIKHLKRTISTNCWSSSILKICLSLSLMMWVWVLYAYKIYTYFKISPVGFMIRNNHWLLTLHSLYEFDCPGWFKTNAAILLGLKFYLTIL